MDVDRGLEALFSKVEWEFAWLHRIEKTVIQLEDDGCPDDERCIDGCRKDFQWQGGGAAQFGKRINLDPGDRCI